jgi:hypothetical protein
MRRFGTATVLGGLLLVGASWSLAASDTPKAHRTARRKAVASKHTSKSGSADVKLENLYVDSEIGQVFTVNLGTADQQASAGESVASLGSVHIYQLGSSELEPPETEVAGQADSADPASSADDDEMEPAPEVAGGDEAMEPAPDNSSEEPAAEPAAAPEASPQASQTPPQAEPAAKEASPKTPPPAAASQTPPPPPPPIG